MRTQGVDSSDQGAVIEVINCCGNLRIKSVIEAERKERNRRRTRQRNQRRREQKRYTVAAEKSAKKSSRQKTQARLPTKSRQRHNIGRYQKLREKWRVRSGEGNNPEKKGQECDQKDPQESAERKPDYGHTDQEPSEVNQILTHYGEQIQGNSKYDGSHAIECGAMKDTVDFENGKNAERWIKAVWAKMWTC